jgi:hypothetical protein
MLGFSCPCHIACPHHVQYTLCSQAQYENKETEIHFPESIIGTWHAIQIKINHTIQRSSACMQSPPSSRQRLEHSSDAPF